jgi:hypothetical protein
MRSTHPGFQRNPPIVRPPTQGDTDRCRVAADNLVATRESLAQEIGQAPDERYDWHLATAVVEHDDVYGRSWGWVVRGDELRWADVVVLASAAVGRLDPAHIGACPVGCAACDLRRAVGRVRESAKTAKRAGVPMHDGRHDGDADG